MLDYQGEKFKEFIEKKHIKKVDAAKMLNVGRSGLYAYFNSKNLGRETVRKILDAFGVNEWDIWGTGDINKDISNSYSIQERISELLDRYSAEGRITHQPDGTMQIDDYTLIEMKNNIRQYAEELTIDSLINTASVKPKSNVKPFTRSTGVNNMYIVPIKAYGGFLTGYESPVFLDTLEKAPFPFIKGECFAFEVDGFSMYKDYVPGDFVVTTPVENFDWLSKGKVYVFQTIDGIILKCFDRIENDHIYLYSLNDEYNPVEPIHLKNIKKVYFKEKVIKN
jgi:SOS-response transcriptional repressor LexA